MGKAKRLLLFSALVVLAGSGCSSDDDSGSMESGLRAAACLRKITPEIGVNHSDPIYMAGFDNDRQATGVHDDTWARGVVLESGERKVALFVLDAIGYFNDEVQTIRDMVADLGFDAIVVSSTHVHESADTLGLWGPDQVTSGVDLAYLDFVNQQVADCIREANDKLVAADIRFATGDTRDTSLPPEPDLVADGEILQHLCVGGSFDAAGNCVGGMEVLGDEGPVRNPTTPSFQIRDRDSHDTLATLVNYASHPESLGSDNTLITSDFPHFMRQALEERFGGIAIYMSADLGVLQGPLDVFLDDGAGGEVPRRTFEFAERMGGILAQRAGDALQAVDRWEREPEIAAVGSGPVDVMIENPYFEFLGLLGVFGRRSFEMVDAENYKTTTEMQALRIGPAQFAVTPNELDPQIGNLYRERMANADHKFVVGLGNDEIGYQMPEAKFNPSCFLCFNLNVFDVDPLDECPEETNDCGTVFQNNIGPGADPLLEGTMFDLLTELNP